MQGTAIEWQCLIFQNARKRKQNRRKRGRNRSNRMQNVRKRKHMFCEHKAIWNQLCEKRKERMQNAMMQKLH